MKIFLKFGVSFRLMLKRVLKLLYFSKFFQKNFTVYTQRFLLVLVLKIFYRSLISHYSNKINSWVINRPSSFKIWSQKKRGLLKVNLFSNYKILPSRLVVKENYSPLKRQDKNFSIPLILYIPFIAVYLIYTSKTSASSSVVDPVPGSASASVPLFVTSTLTTPTFSYTIPSLVPAFTSTSLPTVTPQNLVNRQFMDIPFYFPPPSNIQYGSFYTSYQTIKFSYYYPDLGGVNCHSDNWVNGQCKDLTASGLSWRDKIGSSIAVHPDYLSILPFGSMVYVVSPENIKGHYMVTDLCGGCKINNNYYFDFLFPSMPEGLNWSMDVKYVVERVSFDGLFPTPTPFVYNSPVPLIRTPTATPAPADNTATPTATPAPADNTATPTLIP